MSASISPTLAPPRERARAKLAATVLLPTPPLPLTTAIIFFTFGNNSLGSFRWVVVWAVNLTFTVASLFTSNLIALMQAFLIWSFIGHAGVVRITVKAT